ncbi:MAG: nucleotidyl transferase AbiEii/AbiGii toxin family protein [Elusimicrobia bacterium]|nr:nucleotidyl transferase AbiEii/AbiGii toxin family protein [Elusimicrobiota bacterium]
MFRLHPERFVFIGGGALRLLHGSPRSSADLDFACRRPVSEAQLKELAATLEQDLSRLPSLSRVELNCRAVGHDVEVLLAGQTAALLQFPTLTTVPLGGDRRLITGDSLRTELIVSPTLDALLFCKAVAFMKRPSVKGRDAFDIWFLHERGAKLDEADFHAWRRWEELDSSDFRRRLEQVTFKRLKADLSRYLDEGLARRLESVAYAPVIEATRALLAPWLED